LVASLETALNVIPKGNCKTYSITSNLKAMNLQQKCMQVFKITSDSLRKKVFS